MPRRSRSILLPLTAAAATLFLTVKVETLWQGLAVAAEDKPSAQATVDATPHQTALPVAAPSPGMMTPPTTTDATDSLCTTDEMAVLQDLADRRAILEGREHDLDQRTDLLRAAEVRIAEKLSQLTSLKVAVQAQIERRDALKEQEVQSLVKIYETMKPKSAALIFEALDMPTLLLVADRMKERKLAPVLAKMSAEKAKAITVELAKTRPTTTVAADDDGPAG